MKLKIRYAICHAEAGCQEYVRTWPLPISHRREFIDDLTRHFHRVIFIFYYYRLIISGVSRPSGVHTV